MITALVMTIALQAPATAMVSEEIMSHCYAFSGPPANACFVTQFQKLDDELNATFENVLVKVRELDGDWKKGGASYADALKKSQDAWSAYRDAECRLEAFPLIDRHGVIPPATEYGCRTKLTLARLAMMRDSLKER